MLLLREGVERQQDSKDTGAVHLPEMRQGDGRAQETKDHRLRNYIERLIESYPRLCTEAELRRDEENERARRLRVVCAAIHEVVAELGPEDVELLRIVYIDKACTVEGAGLKVHLSKSEAYRRIDRIIDEIAERIGEI